MTSEKICKECKYYRYDFGACACTHKESENTNLISGRVYIRTCEAMRRTLCGFHGSLWEPKEPEVPKESLWIRITKLLNKNHEDSKNTKLHFP